jgi:hypothetical protein
MNGAETNVDLAAALRRLDAWKNASSLSRQRSFYRYPVRGQARLIPGTAESHNRNPIMVEVRDISRGGVGVLCNQPAELGQFWRIDLLDDQVIIASLPVFVRYCRRVMDGAYLIGFEFGIESSILLAMGVSAKDLMEGDRVPDDPSSSVTGDFVGPESVLDSDAA